MSKIGLLQVFGGKCKVTEDKIKHVYEIKFSAKLKGNASRWLSLWHTGLRYCNKRVRTPSSHTITQVKLATVVEGDPKAPFSITTTPRCRGGHYSFL